MRRVEAWLVAAAAAWIAVATALPAQLQQRLGTLPAALQQELRAHDAAWAALTPAQQQGMRQRFADWMALPEGVRRDRREHWQAWRHMQAGQRLQVEAAARTFAMLAPAQQQALRAQFARLEAGARHGWLLGPVLGADFAQLQPLLMQVPPGQREPLLAVLQAMSPGERLDLDLLAQRTAPQHRDELRRGLLSTSATNRAAWLRLRLEQ